MKVVQRLIHFLNFILKENLSLFLQMENQHDLPQIDLHIKNEQ